MDAGSPTTRTGFSARRSTPSRPTRSPGAPMLAGPRSGWATLLIFATLHAERVGGEVLVDAPLAFEEHGGPCARGSSGPARARSRGQESHARVRDQCAHHRCGATPSSSSASRTWRRACSTVSLRDPVRVEGAGLRRVPAAGIVRGTLEQHREDTSLAEPSKSGVGRRGRPTALARGLVDQPGGWCGAARLPFSTISGPSRTCRSRCS